MDTEEAKNGKGDEDEGRKSPRRFSDEDKAAILTELDACELTSEIRAVYKKHKVQAHQVAKWREEPRPRKVRKDKITKPPTGAAGVLNYLESLEERIEALEARHERISKALGGDE